MPAHPAPAHESDWEHLALEYLAEPLGWAPLPGTAIAPGGTPFTPLHHYAPWNVDDDGAVVGPDGRPDATALQVVGEDGLLSATNTLTPLEVLLSGLFNPERFGQILRGFVAFDADDDGLHKRVAKPHQYFAVTKAVGRTVQVVDGDGRAGVVWHTQGSSKSMEMELYAAAIARHPQLLNPTLVVVTDRTDLDTQLYEAFARSQMLTEAPRKVERRAELRDELASRTTGRIYFTTLQKFGLTAAEKRAGLDHPVLSERNNIVLVVDEAHRSHYDNLDGYAWHLKNALPNATLESIMTRYTNSNLTSAEVIAALVEMGQDLVAEAARGAAFDPPLEHHELALYDAVSQNDSAVLLQGEGKLAAIARDLVAVMRRDVKTDWMVRDDVRAKLRSSIKRLLIKHRYPPDKQPEAIRLVILQMETLAPRLAA